ncbi:MAG: NAD-dependent protein deacetylase [Actinomycetota bacterium]|nr:NAD-dependent protein deacetylase [Actinomycetota bacterium]
MALQSMLEGGDVLVLSGAGLSTDSGIPDYRGPSGAKRTQAPMTYQLFTGDPMARHRYWARSFLGWRQIRDARPNLGHLAVTAWQRAGMLSAIITQNVDGLHQAAGTGGVIELHGGLDRTRCLNCGDRRPRVELDARLRRLNPDFHPRAGAAYADGDAELPDSELTRFVMAPCTACGADLLKPDVVFFGENVPADRVRMCFDALSSARALLVLGSSLTVFSGYRFVRAAAAASVPVAIVNQGLTRADSLATVRIDAPLGQVLPNLVPMAGHRHEIGDAQWER